MLNKRLRDNKIRGVGSVGIILQRFACYSVGKLDLALLLSSNSS